MDIRLLIDILFAALVLLLVSVSFIALSSAVRNHHLLRGYVMKLKLVIVGWILLNVILALAGFYAEFSTLPPRLALLLLPPIAGIAYLYRSKTFGVLLQEIPHHRIILVQSFRIVMEVILWLMFIQREMPVQMTFEGRNFDIVVGATALFVGYFGVVKQKMSNRAVIYWNIACVLILANTVINGFLSAPTPFQIFTNEPSTVIIGSFPFVLLPGFVVPFAFALHFLSIRKAVTSNDQWPGDTYLASL